MLFQSHREDSQPQMMDGRRYEPTGARGDPHATNRAPEAAPASPSRSVPSGEFGRFDPGRR
jgi:hypothetical protein